MRALLVGRGRVGSGLRAALGKSPDLEVRTLGRAISPAAVRSADIIVLAVSDAAIADVAEAIAPHLRRGAVVVHCAGARGVDELRVCRARGAAVGVMHPLASFPDPRRHPRLDGTTFVVNGSRHAITACRRLASACGARVVVARTGDPAYHAAAALAANGAAALALASVSILERLGFGRRAAEHAIGGLLETVGRNVQALGVPEALTGPIARGEPETIKRHRKALRRVSRPGLAAYDAVTPLIVACARAAGLDRSVAEALLRETER